MSPLSVLLTIAGYFAVLFTVSYISSRKADNAAFFTGSRQSAWYVVAFAMIGASMSGVTYVSVPGMVNVSGFGYLQMTLGFIAGQLVIAFVLTPLFYRMRLTSIYEYLEQRFGHGAYHAGAWFFFVSKLLGASVRLFLVCITLQLLIFEPWGCPFWINVAISMAVVWIYTFRGGVKSLIWTDSLKTLCLLLSVVLCIYFIAKQMGLSYSGLINTVADSEMSRIFFLDDVNNKQYFWKQFLAGMFTMIAMTGLDQDMMQRNLSCKNPKDAQKNMLTSIFMQTVVITLFLMLGVLLYTFAETQGITIGNGDELFPLVATGGRLPLIVGVLFIIGLTSSAYSAAGSALTALTTSFTVDILGAAYQEEKEVKKIRRRVHTGMAVAMGIVILIIRLLNNTSVIDAVYTLASYTYGPILGMFAFGILLKREVYDRYIPLICILSPFCCFILHQNSERWFGGYRFSYELLILNAVFTFIGLLLLSHKKTASIPASASNRFQ